MNLDNLQFKASVRSGWQAIDLGFLMARAWWRPLFISGALPATLLFLPLLFLLPSDPVWAVVIIWWLAPFWERLPLYFASRKIFGEIVSQTVVFSQLKSLYLNDAIPWLLWRRFGFQRAFDAPVSVLEQLRGSPRSARINVLHGKYSDVALWNQFVCFLTELIFCLGMWILVDFFIPENLGYHAFDVNNDLTLAGEWHIAAAAFFALIFIMPFLPIVLLVRFVAIEIMPLIPLRSRISTTFKVALLGIWSTTVPSFIAEMLNSFFIFLHACKTAYGGYLRYP